MTRRAGLTAEHGVKWESDGGGEYTIEIVDKPARGTEVTLHLREGEDELLNGFRLRSIIRKYSDHITLPILMKKEEWDKDKERENRVTDEDETVNQAGALWARPKSEITEEQYHEFYKHVAHDFEPPLAYSHNKVEGTKEYTQLLYIPSHAPFDLWDREHRRGIKLYVRRVFIMDDAEHLMPIYLRFVRGVIDSNDLPLNVSREILQESRDVEMIRAGSVKRVLSMLEDLAENDKEKYATFWKEFGVVFKEGPRRRPREPGARRQALPFRVHAQGHRRAGRVARRLRGPHEGRPGQDLLRCRRKLHGSEEQPAPRDLPQERDRSAAALRPRRRVGAVVLHRVRRQAPAVGRERRPRPGQARGRSGEERSRRRKPANSRT